MGKAMSSDPPAPPVHGEILTDVQRRRRWSTTEKIRLVEESQQPGSSVSFVAILPDRDRTNWLKVGCPEIGSDASREYLPSSPSRCSPDHGAILMFYFDKRLQYPVKVENPDPVFARMLQQAIGGIEGEIRVCMQYFFQAWGARGPTTKYRDMLLHTATEEIGHVEMLATAVAMNLEKAPTSLQEAGAADGVVGAVMGGGSARHTIEGMLHRHLLSTGMAAFPANSDGVPFDMSHIYASGNLAADMYCNVAAESTGRVLAVRLYNAAHDTGMKDMLHFMIARDTMHQQQ